MPFKFIKKKPINTFLCKTGIEVYRELLTDFIEFELHLINMKDLLVIF